MTTPRCPWCNTSGIKNVQAAPVAVGMLVLYCGQCGAIFGVAPGAAREAPNKAAKAADKAPDKPQAVQLPPRSAPVVVKAPPSGGPSPEHVAAMSPLFSQGGSLYRVVRRLDDELGENT